MKCFRLSLAVVAMLTLLASCGGRSGKARVLVFSKTAGFRHGSIGAGKAALLQLGSENNFVVDTTENADYFTEDSLKNYSAVIFLNTTGDVLNQYQQADFERYIQAGGGFVGVHAATDCEYSWPWYGKLVGAYFKSHPKIQPAKILVTDKSNPATEHLPDVWERTDEWYNFRVAPSDSNVKILASIDEKSYEGGENGDKHPMVWCHEYDGGRAFYTEFGHTDESYADPMYLKHLLGAVQYAIGGNKALDYSKASSQRPPEEDRFTKNVLASGFDEPTEMAILPDLSIVVVQRKGEILYYDNKSKQLSPAGKLDVYFKTTVKGVNAEEGLLGIAADPDYKTNNYIYLFYSPTDTSVNRLSRFVFKDGKLDVASEKRILQFYSQRDICCHTGGSIAFGPDRLLYLSTGDNSTPFNQPNTKNVTNGFGPMDERPGNEQYDARRSSANANDLRGKILRIKLGADGTYSIPNGNLFPQGTEGTKPEIYVMGTRNPYRISVDQKTGFLYWGEVGPDAREDSMATRGPRGYDELNQARKAGFFGWPLFVGNNYPYRDYDYATGQSGPAFDPQHPVNDSRNNTGIKDLPAVSSAFIYYPYAASPEFPELGTGGRNAMAGPVYYADAYPKDTRLPDYYNGKLLFYEWIRGWMKWVTMDAQGNFVKTEPFMEHTKNNAAIDIEMGPDGRLYVLEYGSGWFTKNPDAALSRIDYNAGNRAPKTKLAISKSTGSLPFTVKANAEGSVDPDNDKLTYVWHFGSETKETTTPESEFTFTKAGSNDVYVEVKDDKGATTKSEVKQIYAGNETPELTITLDGNPQYYIPGVPVKYRVAVTDKEDGSSASGGIDPAGLFVKVDYVSGTDKAQVVGHQMVSQALEGKSIAMSLDCKTCHKEAEKSIGPSFQQVAAKYGKQADARSYLVKKIINGGGGVWGETAMSAHPDLKEGDAGKIVDWILSMSSTGVQKSLPAEGSIVASSKDAEGNKFMQITATYTDKGGAGISPLTGAAVVLLKSPVLSMGDNKGLEKTTLVDYGGMKLAMLSGSGEWLMFDSVNLVPVKQIELGYGMQDPLKKGYVVELVADDINGPVVATGNIPAGGKAGFNSTMMKVTNAGTGPRKLYLRVRKADPGETNAVALATMKLISGK
ncbi:ThuA domain-containing protein [Pollutibacter soli]|uniref:ThuA domain-containing protein n=1 Tax=Pollutibacter soli TaxID=3034157 RepID=UPI003013DD77